MIAFQIKCSLFSDSMWFATHILPWLLEAGPPYIFSFQLFSVSNCRKPSLKSRPLPTRRPRLLGADPLQQQSVFLTSFPTFFIIVWTNPDKILGSFQIGSKLQFISNGKGTLSLLPTIIALQVGIQNNNLYPWWEKGPCFAIKIPVFVMLSLLSHPWDC